jgi:hypothetical protein
MEWVEEMCPCSVGEGSGDVSTLNHGTVILDICGILEESVNSA